MCVAENKARTNLSEGGMNLSGWKSRLLNRLSAPPDSIEAVGDEMQGEGPESGCIERETIR